MASSTVLQVGITEALFLALIAVVGLFFLYGRGKRYRLPPGPLALPVVGNVFTFLCSKNTLPEVLTDLAKTYGPIFSLRFGNIRAVVINSIELAKEALLTNPTQFAGRPRSHTLNLLSEGGKDIVLGDFGPVWKSQRKIASKALRDYLSGHQLDSRVEKAAAKAIDLMIAEKGAFDPRSHISMLIMNFVCAFIFGRTYDLNDPELEQLLSINDAFLELATNGRPEDVLPALRHLRFRNSTKLYGHFDTLLEKFQEFYNEHEKKFDPDNINDLTDYLIACHREARETGKDPELAKLDNSYFIQILSDIYFGGVDTSRFTLLWAVLHMMAFPDVQEKCHKEIIGAVGTSRMPGHTDKKLLSYTEATLYESMRLGTTSPTGIPHQALVDGQIGGYDIPKDTMVIINQWALHKDPKCWPDPDEFRPERFLNEDGTLAPKPESFIPFSMGRRVCVGEPVAKPELLVVFSVLLQRLKFSLPPGESLNLDPKGGMAGFIPYPYKVIVEARF